MGASHQRYPFFLVAGGGFMDKRLDKKALPPKMETPTPTTNN